MFKSPADLDITPEEHAGLIAIMEHLRKPQIVHVISEEWDDAETGEPTEMGFNMSISTGQANVTFDCGCVACIGGHLSLLLQGVSVLDNTRVRLTTSQTSAADYYVLNNVALSDLFMPPVTELFGDCWHLIKPATAADAIESFLTWGIPDWKGAARKNGQSHLVRRA
ncbi:hypothetical protein [Methylobacterium organophilum]|uniref:Uncharacterized protein n=1 Tax=Methylobacterium organophilum TaxID=410 RepID=A0ABQ4TI14_METOR|nr:hypothetical protein [Methylobacterium organophilum]GJE29785.1 hypothetical protein LKMONMHP_4671 [Methylobacterium organophilum]